MAEDLKDVFMFGIGGETQQKLYEVAKKKNKSVGEVVSDALNHELDRALKTEDKQTEKKLLVEG